jgi:hypothetical protein
VSEETPEELVEELLRGEDLLLLRGEDLVLWWRYLLEMVGVDEEQSQQWPNPED